MAMSLDKAIAHGKEHRATWHVGCPHHGACKSCNAWRQFASRRRAQPASDEWPRGKGGRRASRRCQLA